MHPPRISHGKLIGVIGGLVAAVVVVALTGAALLLVDARLPIGIGFHPR